MGFEIMIITKNEYKENQTIFFAIERGYKCPTSKDWSTPFSTIQSQNKNTYESKLGIFISSHL